MRIRRATGTDVAAVDALLARAYPRLLKRDYAPSLLVTAIPLIARAQPRLVASGRYFLAESEAGIIGAGGWSAAAPGRRGTVAGEGHVRHVVTDDRALRRGVGRAVMEAAMADAASGGMLRLECLSTLTAVPFYAALGFEAVGPVTVPLAPGIDFPAVRMIWAL